jgi:predicted Zn-dependent peptidase
MKTKLTIFIQLLFILLAFDTVQSLAGGLNQFDVDGITVILYNTPKDVISVRLFVKGGTANYPLDKQGVESFAYNLAITGGTVTMNKNDFLSAAEKIGTEFGSDASLDYGEMNMRCLKTDWNASWNLFSDAIMNPAFSNTEYAVKKEQFIAEAKQNESNPDNKLDQLAFSIAFKGKNYEKNPLGTSESLAKLTLEDLKAYYKEALCKKRAFIVVVGNVDQTDITEKIKSTLSKLPDGTPAKPETPVKLEKPGQNIVDRNIATNYICGLMTGVDWSSPDAAAMMVAMNIMYEKYFVELRTKRSLSYAPAMFIVNGAITSPLNMVYITTEKPKEALKVMVEIINNVQKNGFTDDELKDSKNVYLTYYFMRMETSASQSSNIGRWYLRNNLKMYEKFEQEVNNVSLQTLNRVFKSNIGSLKWTYLGDKTKVSPDDFKQVEKVSW